MSINDPEALATKLVSRDVVQIKSIPNWTEKATIELSGELNFPGTYTIYKDDTLYDVIQRAGGLTQYAYTAAALFTRKELREQQALRVAEMKRKLTEDIAKAELVGGEIQGATKETSSANEIAEAQKLLSLLDQSPVLGRLVIDLDRILSNTEDYQISLQDGDRLHVPMQQNSVTVIGEVQQPISQIYQPEIDYWDYVKKSGGTTSNADESRIYIVKASGDVVLPESSSWFSSRSTKINPGDTIVVPLHPEKVDQVILWKDLTQIFYQLGLGAAAVGSL
jgi:protein involved in polysaccharide export with SLBB domain